MKSLTGSVHMHHAQHSACTRVFGWAIPAAVSTIGMAKLFTTKINRSWEPGGLPRGEKS